MDTPISQTAVINSMVLIGILVFPKIKCSGLLQSKLVTFEFSLKIVQSGRHSTWISSDFLVFCLVCSSALLSNRPPTKFPIFYFLFLLRLGRCSPTNWDLKVELGISKLASYRFISGIGIFQVEVLRSNCPHWYFQVGVLLTVWAFAVQLGELASRSPRIRRARKIPLFLLRPTDPPHLRSTHRSDFLHKVLLIDVLVFQLGILTVLRFFSSYTLPILTNTQFISYNTFLTDGSLFGNSLLFVSYISRQSMCTSCHVLTIFLAPHQMSQIFSINWLTTTRAPAKMFLIWIHSTVKLQPAVTNLSKLSWQSSCLIKGSSL